MIKHIPLNQNILQKAIKEINCENCLLLFPTRKSKKEAQKLYQSTWDFSEHQFLTMDEWKESFLTSYKPILKEEKRTLALYQALTSESKDFFKIRSYHQSIDFSHNFFGFWEEILEELVLNESITEILAAKQTSGDWQLKTFEQLLLVKQNYQDHLQTIGFTDNIFIQSMEDSLTTGFTKIIVVNQFYFTNSEKKLLADLEDKVIILTQIPAECFNQENLTISPEFSAWHIKPFIWKKLQVHTSADQTQMIAQMATELAKTEQATIIDFQFDKQPYSHLLSPDFFSRSTTYDFSQTRFFRFFQVFSELLTSIIWEGKPFLISLQSVLKLVSTDSLVEYFTKDNNEQESVRDFIFELIDNDFRFLDLELIKSRKPAFLPLFENIFSLITKFRATSSIKELIEFLQVDVDLDYLLSDLNTKSNLVEVFYESLADFISIEEIELVADWKKVFPQKLPENLLKLFLDYFKSKKLKLEIEAKQTNFDITTLQDTRNLDFDNLFILNVVEGILPDKKHTQFLLSENQRKDLGLKTYEDITLRDKFYFYRLFSNSRNPVAFTRNNLEENVEISSFLEELKIYDLLEENKPVDFSNLQKQLFGKLLKTKNFAIPEKSELSKDFFSFTYNKKDFKDNKLDLSFYKWDKLQKNPFEFYLEFIVGIKSRNAEIGEDFSVKLIGTIAHEIITLVWKRLIDIYQSNNFKHNFIYNTKLYVQQAIDHFLQYNRDFKYISPHNFSNNFFLKVFIPILIDGIENFFYRLHNDLNLSEKEIVVFPETDRSESREFTKIDNLDIYLKGRPDLRIHSEDKKYIFDFKTGTADPMKTRRYSKQLQFYENICYLIEIPQIIEQLNSYLFFIEQEDMKHLSKRIELKKEIEETLKQIIETGYDLAEKKDKYEDIDITRRDLLKKELAE